MNNSINSSPISCNNNASNETPIEKTASQYNGRSFTLSDLPMDIVREITKNIDSPSDLLSLAKKSKYFWNNKFNLPLQLNFEGNKKKLSLKKIGACSYLQRLNLALCKGIPASDFSDLASLDKLEELDLTFTNISGQELQKIASNLKNLKRLSLDHCSSLSANDFSALVLLDALETLWVRATSIPQNIVQQLTKQKKNLKIHS